jgi:hypothetical protein
MKKKSAKGGDKQLKKIDIWCRVSLFMNLRKMYSSFCLYNSMEFFLTFCLVILA